MSQRWIIGETYDVMTGWDRPLQYHFMVIQDKKGRIVYSNMRDDRNVRGVSIGCRGMTLEQIQERLSDHGLAFPDWLKALLSQDADRNVGGECSYHHEDGTEAPNVGSV